MARYQRTLVNQNDALPIQLADSEAELLLIQVRGGTTPNLVLEISMDGTNWDDVEVSDLDTPGTGAGTITGDGLYQPTSDIGGAGEARVRRTDTNGGNAVVVASTAAS